MHDATAPRPSYVSCALFQPVSNGVRRSGPDVQPHCIHIDVDKHDQVCFRVTVCKPEDIEAHLLLVSDVTWLSSRVGAGVDFELL